MDVRVYKNLKEVREVPYLEDFIKECGEQSRVNADFAFFKTGTSAKTPKLALAEDNVFIVLVDDKDFLVGSVQVRIVNRISHIIDLAVLPQYRGQGFGKKLMEEATNFSKEENCTEIRLVCAVNNTAAEGLYGDLGFSPFTVAMFKKL